jgi:outer membrane lipoprotein carrier protein
MRKFAQTLLVLLLSFPFLLSADTAKSPLINFLSELESFKADFSQTLSNEQGDILETSNGEVFLQNPGKFRWVYEEPYSQLIITDGETLWLYDQDLEQVTIRDVSKTIDKTPAAIISGQENIDKYYVTTELGKIEGYDWMELTPRDIENQYSSIRLGFNKDELGMMVMFDNLGQVTRIDFNNPVRNKRFGGPLFTFEIPENVDVIDDRQLSEQPE